MKRLRLNNIYSLLALLLSPGKDTEILIMIRSFLSREDIRWDKLLLQANVNLCSPLLYVRLKQDGLLHLLPDELSKYLESIYSLNLDRNLEIIGNLKIFLGYLQKSNIKYILLKGASTYFDNLYSDLGARLLTDIDIYVERKSIDITKEILSELGYLENISSGMRPEGTPADNRLHHIHPYYKPDTPLVIEVHYRLGSGKIGDIFSENSVWDHAVKIGTENLTAYILDPTARIIHNTISSLLAEAAFIRGYISLKNLADFSYLAAEYSNRIDWKLWNATAANLNLTVECQAYIMLAAKIMRVPLPDKLSIKPLANMQVLRLEAAGNYLITHKNIPESLINSIFTCLIRGLLKIYYFCNIPVWAWENVCYTGESGHVTARLRYFLKRLVSPGSWRKI